MRVLIVDDDTLLLQSLVRTITSLGHQVITAHGASSAMKRYPETFDAIITDMQMPDGNGIELLQALVRLSFQPPTYVHSGDSTFAYLGSMWHLPRDIPRYFGHFASFREKDRDMTKNIEAFLTSIKV
jgi:YesN/AraC family two-component response regulator